MIRTELKRIFVLATLIGVLGAFLPSGVGAQSVDDLEQKIKERNERIKALEQEISHYQLQVQSVGAQAKTLQSAVYTLEANGKKLSTELKLTETNIDKTRLTIEELSSEIGTLEKDIRSNTEAIAQSIRDMNVADDRSLIEIFLLNADITTAWEEIDEMESLQRGIRDRVSKLQNIQAFLGQKVTETENQKKQLEGLKSTLSDKKQLVDQNKKQQSALLAETKNKEAEYKALLASKEAERKRAEQELFEYESQLQIVIDKSKIAPAGKGVLQWPLDNVRVTQYFGRTVDAARLYTSGTHNGIDLGVPRGTPVKASRAGVVKGIGNTDAQRGCYSYGKWVLVEHDNGLSTLYAHLDLIKVSQGQTVATGELLGYSGQTGYATGPHLHFTVYATQGVRVQQYTMSINCKQVSIPIADQKAYLDPMLYL